MVRYAGREAGLRSQRPEVRILSGAPLGVARGAGARGPLAQLVEQLTLNQRVGGSSPPRPTNKTGASRAPEAPADLRCAVRRSATRKMQRNRHEPDFRLPMPAL